MTCDFCGKRLGFGVLERNGKRFCSADCEYRFFLTPDDRKQIKYNEIARKAWDLFVHVSPDRCGAKNCWELAEKFCEFAKQKKKEMLE